MENTAQIEFQGFTPTAPIREAIETHIAGLEKRYGRLTSCRIVVKGPGERHRNGGHYEVHLRLALPGGEIDVARAPDADERHSDLAFAVNDAFKRARRQLDEKVRRQRGEIKTHPSD
jgi:ribosome-associated translation inhibitor RaiA